MRFRAKHLIAGLALVALVPALAQRAPESILPPGFGEPEPAPEKAPETEAPAARPERSDVPETRLQLPNAPTTSGTSDPDEPGNEIEPVIELVDLPPAAKRSLDGVGLEPGMGAAAFGEANGGYLSRLMRSVKAPVASRWLQITLRRALLAPSATPEGRSGADWVADRAWLLVRMGEADNARALVSRVDGENYSSWLYDVAMQASLATADPAGLCGIADAAAAQSKKASWTLTRAICAGLEGEGGTASALSGQVRDRRQAGGVDVLLAEKVAGAGSNTRRAINIEWEPVEKLTAWRYGMATATAVSIPARLYATAGPQVQAWAARAPLLSAASRLSFADRAATLGVFSSAALVDLHAGAWDVADPAERSGLLATKLRETYAGAASSRVPSLRAIWDSGEGATGSYARLILTARASAMLPGDALGDDSDRNRAIAAMMSAGLDAQAARLANAVVSGQLGWALLAVGAPRAPFSISGGQVDDYDGRRGQMLFAALAGLGRLDADDVPDLAESLGVAIGRQNAWTAAIDRAANARQPGTVALLAAAGMQTPSWAGVPPEHLYHIVLALRRVGLEGEARMIAAEAITRT